MKKNRQLYAKQSVPTCQKKKKGKSNIKELTKVNLLKY